MKVFCPRFAILSRRSRPQLPPVYDDNFFCKPSFFIPTVFYTVTANISITEKGKEKTRAQITGKFNRRQPLFFIRTPKCRRRSPKYSSRNKVISARYRKKTEMSWTPIRINFFFDKKACCRLVVVVHIIVVYVHPTLRHIEKTTGTKGGGGRRIVFIWEKSVVS